MQTPAPSKQATLPVSGAGNNCFYIALAAHFIVQHHAENIDENKNLMTTYQHAVANFLKTDVTDIDISEILKLNYDISSQLLGLALRQYLGRAKVKDSSVEIADELKNIKDINIPCLNDITFKQLYPSIIETRKDENGNAQGELLHNTSTGDMNSPQSEILLKLYPNLCIDSASKHFSLLIDNDNIPTIPGTMKSESTLGSHYLEVINQDNSISEYRSKVAMNHDLSMFDEDCINIFRNILIKHKVLKGLTLTDRVIDWGMQVLGLQKIPEGIPSLNKASDGEVNSDEICDTESRASDFSNFINIDHDQLKGLEELSSADNSDALSDSELDALSDSELDALSDFDAKDLENNNRGDGGNPPTGLSIEIGHANDAEPTSLGAEGSQPLNAEANNLLARPLYSRIKALFETIKNVESNASAELGNESIDLTNRFSEHERPFIRYMLLKVRGNIDLNKQEAWDSLTQDTQLDSETYKEVSQITDYNHVYEQFSEDGDKVRLHSEEIHENILALQTLARTQPNINITLHSHYQTEDGKIPFSGDVVKSYLDALDNKIFAQDITVNINLSQQDVNNKKQSAHITNDNFSRFYQFSLGKLENKSDATLFEIIEEYHERLSDSLHPGRYI